MPFNPRELLYHKGSTILIKPLYHLDNNQTESSSQVVALFKPLPDSYVDSM